MKKRKLDNRQKREAKIDYVLVIICFLFWIIGNIMSLYLINIRAGVILFVVLVANTITSFILFLRYSENRTKELYRMGVDV